MAPADAAYPGPADKFGSLKHTQVLGDRRPRHTERPRQLAHGGIAVRQTRQDAASGSVGERAENLVERLIGNHEVTNVAGLASAVNSGNRLLQSGVAISRALSPQISLPCPDRRLGANDKDRDATMVFIGPRSSLRGIA